MTETWPQLDPARDLVAYLCAEFGLDEHLPIYAGGLGVLAGDHLKTASDLGVPLVAVGLILFLPKIAPWFFSRYGDRVIEPVPGANLVLTIDADLQRLRGRLSTTLFVSFFLGLALLLCAAESLFASRRPTRPLPAQRGRP